MITCPIEVGFFILIFVIYEQQKRLKNVKKFSSSHLEDIYGE
jgi:hypothetical protein